MEDLQLQLGNVQNDVKWLVQNVNVMAQETSLIRELVNRMDRIERELQKLSQPVMEIRNDVNKIEQKTSRM